MENTETMNQETSTSKKRGFALMTPERVREIAAMGGKASHDRGVAYRFTKEVARENGRKGGLVAQSRARARKEEKSPESNNT